MDAVNDTARASATAREWIGLLVIALPCLLYSMDLMVLNLAVPALTAKLRPSGSELLWIIDIYGFLVAGSLIPMGTLGDRIGRRRLLLIGAAAFGATSVLAAFANSTTMLIAARALLGLAGATLAPSTLALIRNMFQDARQRTIAIGIWVSSYSAGAALGPLVGGALLEHFWPGSVFLVGVPAMGLLLLVGPRLLPEFRDPAASRIDMMSAGLSLSSVLMLIYAVKRVAVHGMAWAPLLVGVAGLGLGVAFVQRQQRSPDPFLDLKLFRVPLFGAALLTYALASFVAFGAFVFIAQYLQLVVGLSPLRAGLWTTPFSVAFVAGSLVTPMLARRLQSALVMALGLGLAAIGFGVLTQVGRASGPELVAAGFVTYALGIAPVVTLATDFIIGIAPAERAGAAAAVSETASELGGALGVAILGSLGAFVYRNEMAEAVARGNLTATSGGASDTLGAALAFAKSLPEASGSELTDAAREAFMTGFRLTSGVAAVIVATLAFVAAVFLKSPREKYSAVSENANVRV